ncbi:Probable efflux pump outer membrane protein ttgC precursor [Achromobacter denitrificans]|jgi:NodT family efflux transporter outer membrane factor (OMF) lipoprotein|uniref:efflux transporter outer membrane subunit n=1 Tax=Achromobacter denitrificans TaxID=32002 RepID=UPI000ADFECC5|nr:putative efflux pump outer membrane protein TtgC [Achromobacter denitrificans]SUW34049.1 Probable efflux pump outer membrane protein ttgC precursor [Achromobacter denitrificans]
MKPMTMTRFPIRPFRLAALPLTLALGACAFAPDGKPPAVAPPAQYGVAPTPAAGASAQGVAQRFEQGARPVPEWWKRYGSAALDALVEEGLAHSPDLAAAERNLAGAREQLRGQVNSSMLPSVDAGADASRRRALTMPNLPEPTARYNVFTGQIHAQYDLDLFGAARFANLSLAAQVAQQAFQLESARRSLAGNIVTGAIAASALAQRVALTEKQAVLARQVARDTQRRYELGAASQNDALDADQDAASLEASLPGLRARWHATRHALAVLLGRTPDQAPPDLDFDMLAVPEQVPVVVPSELLASRPDILLADAVVQAAAADVGAATAQLFPSLSLSASMGQAGFNWPAALSGAGSIWAIGASLTQPIFHGGALLAERNAAKERYEASLLQYKQTVLTAFRDVADTLSRLDAGGQALASAESSRQAAEQSYRNTASRVRLGALPPYTEYAAEQHYVAARLREVDYADARLTETAALFQAMGSPVRAQDPAPR